MNKLISLLRPSIIFFFSLLIFSTAAIQFSQAKPARKLMRVAFSPPPPPLSARQACTNHGSPVESMINGFDRTIIKVTQPPSDSVSSPSFSPKEDLLVGTSWDNEVRCWETKRSGTSFSSTPKALISHAQPVLCSTWKDDGTTVFSGGSDNQIKMWPLISGAQPITVAMHEAPIKDVAWIPEMNVLVTGSWDKTLKYWDTTQASPVHNQPLPDWCYTLPVRHPVMVVGTADKNIIVFNLHYPQRLNSSESPRPLTHRTRCVSVFPDKQGFLVGSIEGRVGVQHLDNSKQNQNFTFKCHRDGLHLYSVNSINFHPVYHTVLTTGSDGGVHFWDKDHKQKLKSMARNSLPIPCSTFNKDGSIFAYSACYDWSKGAAEHNPVTAKSYIYLHSPQDSDVKPIPQVVNRRK